jgi:diguanylate cyclase (GGDEF)-like protein/PAS domain S-box-containing protein
VESAARLEGEPVQVEKKKLSLKRQQLQLLFQQAPMALGGALVTTVITVWVMSDVVEPEWLWGWAGVTVFFYLFRLALALGYRRNPPEPRSDARWEERYLVATFGSGMSWGVGASTVLFPSGSIMHQAFLILVLAGISASTIVPAASLRWCSPLNFLPSILPMAFRCFYEGDRIHIIIGLLVLIYAAALYISQGFTHKAIVRSLALHAENEGLVQDLKESNSRLVHAQRIAGLGHWEWDPITGKLEWSDQMFLLFGFEPGQLVNMDIVLQALHPEDRDSYRAACDRVLLEPVALEYRIILHDRTIRSLRDEAELVDEPGRGLIVKGVTSDVSERIAAQKKTRGALREVNRILENMQDTYYRADAEGRLTYVSRSVASLLGYLPDECLGQPIAQAYVNPKDREQVMKHLEERGGSLRNYEVQLRHKKGHGVWVSVNAQFLRNASGQVIGVEGTARDTGDLRQAQEALHQEKERALVTLQSIGDGVITTDEQGRIQFLNPVAERLLGQESEMVAGKHYLDVLRLNDETTGEALGDLVKLCLGGDVGVVHADEGMFVHPDGSRFHLKVTAAPMRNRKGRVVGAVLALHDITEVMGMARQLSYQASHDMLTGLYNRQLFEKKLEEAIRSAQSGKVSHVLFYMDLDQFKLVNDTCGHQAGDELLEQVAMLMQKRLRESDTLARLGGDEFGVLLESCPLTKAVDIAEEIRKTIRDFRFGWQDKAFDIGVSVGVVPIDNMCGNLADVLAAADAACYVAKDNGRNRIHIYQPDDSAVAQRHGEMQWVHRLSAAFEENRFVLYAQPIVHLNPERLVAHYEILMRMLDKKGGVVPPMAFIPAAERYNLMPTVDRWVVRTTFTMMREAQGQLAFPPVNCAINLSGQSLNDDHFLEFVVDLFDDTGVPPESICFEITETAAIANLARATRFINVLRDMGCSFALDDFGSGLSSFAYLKNLPVDYLKIDGSFIKDMADDRVDRAMVESINDIGHVLGLKTIAEFAESDAVLSRLEEIGVDYAQGAGVQVPVDFTTVLATYAEWRKEEEATGSDVA